MSFVISELPRELNFSAANGCGAPSVGPNLGPGSYNAQVPSGSKGAPGDKKGSLVAPFGTSTRRKLNMPHIEMLQDLTQFRLIPDAKNHLMGMDPGTAAPNMSSIKEVKNVQYIKILYRVLQIGT
jgi:hypothetical protein